MHSWWSSTLIKIIICDIFPSTSARVQLLVSSQHILQPDSFFRMTRIFCKFKSDIQCMLCNFLFVYLPRCWSYLILVLTILHSNICSVLELTQNWSLSEILDLLTSRRPSGKSVITIFWHKIFVHQFLWVCCSYASPSWLPKHMVLYYNNKIEEYSDSAFLTGNITLNSLLPSHIKSMVMGNNHHKNRHASHLSDWVALYFWSK